jgi:hypothetical protein
MADSGFFEFERSFVDSLQCIPMQVRLKLDTCGVKLKLFHWSQFSHPERQRLVALPCEDPDTILAYRTYLQQLVVNYTGTLASEIPVDPHPPWLNAVQVPAVIQDKAQACGVSFSLEQWQTLNPVQRFALLKLSRPSHENRNFVPALQEFGLV